MVRSHAKNAVTSCGDSSCEERLLVKFGNNFLDANETPSGW